MTRRESAYEKWRQSMVWQMNKPDRYPELIVRPTSVDEVAEVIRYARSAGLKVAVKSGGGNNWANFLRDGGMLLDMWNFRMLNVDPGAGTAQVGPSVWSYQLIHEVVKHGFAFPVAHGPACTFGGFLLGGGLGINWDNWGGMSCFSILGAEVVTADGKVLYVTPERHPDLYWAVRGGGNGFPGVVTRFHLQLYPLPRFITQIKYSFPASRIADVADWLDELAESGLEKTEIGAFIAPDPSAPVGTPIGETLLCGVRTTLFADTETEAQEILERFSRNDMARESETNFKLQPLSLETLLVGTSGQHRKFGLERKAVDAIWTDNIKQALGGLKELYTTAPTRRSRVSAFISTRRDPLAAAAFSVRAKAYIGFGAVWDAVAEDEANIAWLRKVSAAMQPYATGHYINEVDVQGQPQKVHSSFSAEAWQRLRTVRMKYDPDGVFHDFFGLANG